MIGEAVTLVRVKNVGHGVRQTFTVRGTLTDYTGDEEGNVVGIRVRGVRAESGEAVDSWWAVGPRALDGSLCVEQSVTLDACGHPLRYGCDCTAGVGLGCDADDCVIRDEPRVISPYGADTLGFSLD